jgi:hypothetical protein
MTKDAYSRDGRTASVRNLRRKAGAPLGSSRQLSREVGRNTTQKRELWIADQLVLAKEIALAYEILAATTVSREVTDSEPEWVRHRWARCLW